MSASTKAGLYLTTEDEQFEEGPKYVPAYDLPTEDGAYTKAKLEQDGASLFVVYGSPNMSTGEKGSMAVKIIDSPKYEFAGFVIRSFQGFNQDGLILFEHADFSGNAINYTDSVANIGDSFPTNDPRGVSSFIVCKGVWELYTKPNFQGEKLKFDGKNQFGPGTRLFVGEGVNDNRIASVKKVQNQLPATVTAQI